MCRVIKPFFVKVNPLRIETSCGKLTKTSRISIWIKIGVKLSNLVRGSGNIDHTVTNDSVERWTNNSLKIHKPHTVRLFRTEQRCIRLILALACICRCEHLRDSPGFLFLYRLWFFSVRYLICCFHDLLGFTINSVCFWFIVRVCICVTTRHAPSSQVEYLLHVLGSTGQIDSALWYSIWWKLQI